MPKNMVNNNSIIWKNNMMFWGSMSIASLNSVVLIVHIWGTPHTNRGRCINSLGFGAINIASLNSVVLIIHLWGLPSSETTISSIDSNRRRCINESEFTNRVYEASRPFLWICFRKYVIVCESSQFNNNDENISIKKTALSSSSEPSFFMDMFS